MTPITDPWDWYIYIHLGDFWEKLKKISLTKAFPFQPFTASFILLMEHIRRSAVEIGGCFSHYLRQVLAPSQVVAGFFSWIKSSFFMFFHMKFKGPPILIEIYPISFKLPIAKTITIVGGFNPVEKY